jgi:BMFP domain-containing protein YqiC
MTRQRLAALEKRIDELASKEAIKALDEKVTTLVGILNSRIGDRRHHE